ncbi:OB-fold domain-containing protein [Paraburkholderia sp. BL10I2N1]|uniref:Zn-ribbon domain-containing OB-fold protein n=1 Tax=Paraburkholderia sp. BL10I2N1 TaxID=1938796 RepID=UPI001FB62EFF|nr:OB-fold domain-containing protein [Paraburkholderia sp. BL10I2N1]
MEERMPAHQSRLACSHLLTSSDGPPRLIGSRCRNCGEVYFAAGEGCTSCRSTSMDSFDIGREGILWSWTIQSFLPKAPYNSGETEADFKPYGVGYVEMPSGVKIESRLSVADSAKLKIGMSMTLAVEPYGKTPDGEGIFTFVFVPTQQTMEGTDNG